MVTLLSKEKIWAGQKFGDPSVHWQIALLNLQEAIVSDWFLHWEPNGSGVHWGNHQWKWTLKLVSFLKINKNLEIHSGPSEVAYFPQASGRKILWHDQERNFEITNLLRNVSLHIFICLYMWVKKNKKALFSVSHLKLLSFMPSNWRATFEARTKAQRDVDSTNIRASAFHPAGENVDAQNNYIRVSWGIAAPVRMSSKAPRGIFMQLWLRTAGLSHRYKGTEA